MTKNITRKKLMLYNLSFMSFERFEPFDVQGYVFHPIPEKQPRVKNIYTPQDAVKDNRRMILNAFVEIPHKQPDSVLYRGGTYSRNRRRKLLDDILVIISCCIGRNVVPKSMKASREFPTASGIHCEIVAKDSKHLKTYLETAMGSINDPTWQSDYEDGFHVRMLYNASTISVTELRFLADITIWEYLYYRKNPSLKYGHLNRVTLNTKMNYLISEFLLKSETVFPEETFRIFSDLRNQLSHSGKLPVENPKSRICHLGWIGCEKYLKLFKRLTQALVLKTLGIDSLDQMSVFNVREFLEEMAIEGKVGHFEKVDRLGISFPWQ